MIKIYTNPKGEAYRNLLAYALKHSPTFVLAERSQLFRSDKCAEVFEQLRPYLLKTVRTNNNSTEDRLAIAYSVGDWIHYYECNEASIEVLASYADSLLDWQHPSLPEDLCFLDHDGKDWLVSIAHEKIMYMEISEREAEKLSMEIQGLFLRGEFNRDIDRLLEDAVRHQTEYLDITGNGIAEIPEQVFQLHNLRSLELFEQHIDRLPERLFDLARLEKLSVWTANLHHLPSAIGKLQHLRHLTIYCGSYHQLPQEGVIKKEDIHFNQLPAEIGELHNLERLDIQYTGLRDLPDTFVRLKKLNYLNLTNNLLTSRPSVLDRMSLVNDVEGYPYVYRIIEDD